MGQRTSYTPGTFSWVELSTTAQDDAKQFFSGLFGWDYDDSPVGDDMVYSMAKVGGDYVGAISPQMEDERKMGVPPHWNNYITVDDADAIAARAGELGGNVLAPPFDVMEVGRMAVLQDPSGGVFCIWQPKQHIGAGLVNAPGALCWNELNTRDPEGAMAFYEGLLGWSFEKNEQNAGGDYWMIHNGGNMNGGVRRMGDEMPAEVPAFWLPYFATESVADTLGKVESGGGGVMMPRTEFPQGALAVARDPAGATFALFEGELQD